MTAAVIIILTKPHVKVMLNRIDDASLIVGEVSHLDPTPHAFEQTVSGA